MAVRPRLGPVRFAEGLHCERRLWLSAREPERADRGARPLAHVFGDSRPLARAARALFPDAVAVVQDPPEHAARATRAQLEDPEARTLLGAVFEHAGVRVAIDVLERDDRGACVLHQVVAATRLRDEHLDDAAVALWVVRGHGLEVSAVELLHPDGEYERGPGSIDWSAYFVRKDITRDAEFLATDVPDQVERLSALLAAERAPDVEPSPHCTRPWPCEFREFCNGSRPDDWIGQLPGLRRVQFHALREAGVAGIRDLPDEPPLAARAERARRAWRGDGIAFEASLARALGEFGLPADYVDFEAIAPAIPRWPGTRPYQMIPFQWSLHCVDADANVLHSEFLHPPGDDPRRGFAESLIAVLGGSDRPLLVYSAFEERALTDLAELLPDLAPALERVRSRIRDLYPLVRGHVYHRDFRGSFSLKRVVAALSPGFGYGDLGEVADGGAAAHAYERLLDGDVSGDAAVRLERDLLAYCARDTQALVALHRALVALGQRAGDGC